MYGLCESCGLTNQLEVWVRVDQLDFPLCGWCVSSLDCFGNESEESDDDDQDNTDFTHVNKERWIRNMRVKRREQRKILKIY